MAKAHKTTQRLHVILLGALLCIVVATLARSAMETIIIFMLTGYVIGTDYSVPAWAMFCLYSGIAAAIGLHYISHKGLENYYLKKLRTNGKLPRRRYSHI